MYRYVQNIFSKRMQKESTVTSPAFTDVSDYSTQIDLTALEVVRSTPAWLTRAERLFLFTFTFGLRPAGYLEIGTFQGGSAWIVASAMEASGAKGRMVCIEPNPQISPEVWKRIESRVTLIQRYSPDALSQAYQVMGAPFDFVFIDGDHTASGVLRDACGVLPMVAPGGYLLFHDAFNHQVQNGLEEFVQRYAQHVVDCGYVTREVTRTASNLAEVWGGLRLMRKPL